MARDEETREDLLRDATALVERIEIAIAAWEEPIVAGFRKDSAASVFFGQQAVYQFNSANQLRRGFLDGRLYKAERGRLVQLTRERTAESVNLVRSLLTTEETSLFLSTAKRRLGELRAALSANQYRVLGQVPQQGDVRGRLSHWLSDLPDCIAVAGSARV